ncbi:hypothetical protein [Janthinobacterium sp. ZB1P44]
MNACLIARHGGTSIESIDDAKKLLIGNPVLNAGGTVEIRALPLG